MIIPTFSSRAATKHSIPIFPFLRLHCIYSCNLDFGNQTECMALFFISRDYHKNTTYKDIERTRATSRAQAMTPEVGHRGQDCIVLLMVYYYPHNLPVKQIMLNNFHLLQQDPKLSTVFRQPPTRGTCLTDHLVHSTLKKKKSIHSSPGISC